MSASISRVDDLFDKHPDSTRSIVLVQLEMTVIFFIVLSTVSNNKVIMMVCVESLG